MTLLALLVLAAELPRGAVVPSVQVHSDPSLSYALYLPSNYTPDRAWPMLYCLDPGARGRVPVERFSKAAEAEGFIVAGSNNSRNGPLEAVERAIRGMLADTSLRFAIDPRRVYAAGHSGGSRVALGWAMSGNLAGVVACGAGFGQPEQPKQIPFTLFAVAGVDDFNYGELHSLSVAIRKSGSPQRFAEFDGGHEWLPEAQALEALRFFSGKLPSRPAVPSKEASRADEQMRRWVARIEGAKGKPLTKIVAELRSRGEAAGDSPQRRAARRALSGAFIGAIEQGRAAMEASKFERAAECYERALAIRPDAGGARAQLEKARAGLGR